jgi:hypothetical protein
MDEGIAGCSGNLEKAEGSAEICVDEDAYICRTLQGSHPNPRTGTREIDLKGNSKPRLERWCN